MSKKSLKRMLVFAALIVFVLLLPKKAHATAKIARSSASVVSPLSKDSDTRSDVLKAYLLQFESPLADYAEEFIMQADLYNLDWKFVASIAGVESWFGNRIPTNSYNGWGWGIYGGRVHRFSSWDEGIQTISQGIRERYMDGWGAKDVYGIGSFYAADPSWARKVTHFMDQIEVFEKKYKTQSLSISI